jgi:hypothetical protein
VPRKRKTIYQGELAKPMAARPALGLLATQEDVIAQTDAHKAEFFRRLMLLCDHYEIEQGNWIMLASLLARDYVPGLQTMRARPGPKTKWGPIDTARANLAIDKISRTQNCTQADAAQRLFRRTQWLNRASSAQSLLRRAQEADPRWIQMLDHAIRYQAKKGPEDEITLVEIEQIHA